MSDLIRREDALKALLKVPCKIDSDNYTWIRLSDAFGTIDEDVPSAEPERKWIPCNERLPLWSEHVDDMVLVCYDNGSIRFDACINGEWAHGNPIAWMPLPEAWRGE